MFNIMPKLKNRTPKYCRFGTRNVAFYWQNGKRIFLPGTYGSCLSLVAYHRAMIDYCLELEKLFNQVAADSLDDCLLEVRHLADKIDLEQK